MHHHHARPEQLHHGLNAGAHYGVAVLHRREKLKAPMSPQSQDAVRAVDKELSAKYPALPKDARILFLSDPLESYDYSLTFLFRLHYRDKDIDVDRMKVMGKEPDAEARKGYQRVFRFNGDQVIEAL